MVKSNKILSIDDKISVSPTVYKILVDIKLLKLKKGFIISQIANKINLQATYKPFREAVDLMISNDVATKHLHLQSCKLLTIDSRKLNLLIENTNMYEITARYIRDSKLIYDAI